MIECSAHFTVLDDSNLLLESQFRNTPTVILLVQNTNVFLANVRADSLNGSVFRSIDTRGYLNILSSIFQGSTEIIYSDGFSSKVVTHITINGSIVYPGIYYKNSEQGKIKTQKGMIIQLQTHITVDITIFNNSFLGREKMIGFLLFVKNGYKTCPLFAIQISHSRFYHRGITIGEETNCKQLSSAYIGHCVMRKMPKQARWS